MWESTIEIPALGLYMGAASDVQAKDSRDLIRYQYLLQAAPARMFT